MACSKLNQAKNGPNCSMQNKDSVPNDNYCYGVILQ